MLETGVEAERREDVAPLLEAGTPAKGEFHCSECGYGVTVHARLPICPMCAGSSWEPSPWTPFTRAAARLL